MCLLGKRKFQEFLKVGLIMKVVNEFSQKRGKEYISSHFNLELDEIYQIIESVELESFRTKVSKEKTMPGEMLYSPRELNNAYKEKFNERGWFNNRIQLPWGNGAFREMDFVKSKLGVEVQLGKYSFMGYDIAIKMPRFAVKEVISAGVEIVPVKNMADKMSSGVSYFEQLDWDLSDYGDEHALPILIIGIDA